MSHSLINFLNEVSSQFNLDLNSKINILEIGCGNQSLFITNTEANIIAIDKSVDLILSVENTENLKYEIATIQDFKSDIEYNIIIDAHCLHCIIDDTDRNNALRNIYNLLSDDGFFISETMIQPANEKVLFKGRVVKTAIEIENEFLENNFKIKYFFISPSLYFEDDDGYKNKCDVLRIVAQK